MKIKIGYIVLCGLAALVSGHSLAEEHFVPIAKDGLHDPEGSQTSLLQEPVDVFKGFPKDIAGNPDWMRTLETGAINPRTGLTGDEKMSVVDLDIIMKNTASMPYVKYRHSTHTQWLTCSNCHTKIFQPQRGGNFITMASILEGNYCGVCHGKVAFNPKTDCMRCHSVPENTRGLR